MTDTEKLIKIYEQLEEKGLIVIAGKKDDAELMVSYDVVPVVRCKDCKHLIFDKVACEKLCNHPCGLYSVIKDADYCSYGERKYND